MQLIPDSLAVPDSVVRADTTALLETITTGLADEVGPGASAMIVLGGALVLGLVVQYAVLWLGRFALRKQPWWLGIRDRVLPHLRRATVLTVAPLFLYGALPLVELSDGPRSVLNMMLYVSVVLGMASLAFAASHTAGGLLVYRFDRGDLLSLRARKVQTQVDLLQRVASVIIITLTLAALMFYFEPLRRVGAGLLTSAGIAGIVLGLAAQKTLGNLIAGIQIAISQPIRVDDAVVVEGEWGRIEEMTLTYVVVKTWDMRRLMLPISYFIEQPFQNWTRTSTDLLAPVLLHLDYRAPIDALRAELADFLPKQTEWNGEVERVQVTDATERTITIRVLASAKDSADTFTLRCAIREHLIAFLREHHPEALPHSRVLGEGGLGTDSASAPPMA